MEKNSVNKNVNAKAPYNAPEALVFPGRSSSGINPPDVELPAFNPPVPNRAWTAMTKGLDIDELGEEEKRDLYVGRDGYC